MAVPTITSLTPAAAVADGTEKAYITGTGFAERIEVRFGEAIAVVDGVFTEGPNRVAIVRVPKFSPAPGEDPGIAGPGVVDVSVQNLDEDSSPVVGEVAVRVDAFTMTRTPTTTPGDLSRLMGTIVTLLRREVLEKVTFGVAVDYDASPDDALRVVEVATTPAIILSGPKMTVANNWRVREPRPELVVGGPDDVFETRTPGLAYHMELALNVVTEAGAKRQLFNLVEAIGRFLNANRRLSMLRVEGDPSSGVLRWPLTAGQVRMTLSSDQSPNVAVWEITILGVQIDSGRPLARGRTVDEVVVDEDVL